MLESNVWKKLYKYIRLHKPSGNWIIQRIETGGTVRGFPDVLFLEDGRAIFIELKVVKGNKVMLSPEQVNTLTTLARAGFAAWIVAYKQIKQDAAYFLGAGIYAEDIYEHGINSKHMHMFNPFDTLAVYDMLTTMGIVEEIEV